MRTPAVYDLQTEKLAYPETDAFTIGTAADVSAPVAEPWGNRGGVDNIRSLLADVAPRHATVSIEGDVARVVPNDDTAAIYVESRALEATGASIRNGETIVLGTGKSDLWAGYRLQVFF